MLIFSNGQQVRGRPQLTKRVKKLQAQQKKEKRYCVHRKNAVHEEPGKSCIKKLLFKHGFLFTTTCFSA